MKRHSEPAKVEELLNLPVIQQLQDGFADLTGAAVVLCRRDGRVLTRPSFGDQRCRSICQRVDGARQRFGRHAVRAARRMSRTDQTVRRRVRGGGYQCFAPIVISAGRVATLVVVTNAWAWFDGLGDTRIAAAVDLAESESASGSGAVAGIEPAGLDSAVEFLRSLTAALAEWSRRERQVRLRVREFAVLHSVASLYAGRADLDGILQITATQVVAVTQAKACSIRIFDREKSELRIKAVANLSDEYLRKGPVKLADSKVDQLALRGDPVPISDMADDPRVLYSQQAKREGLVSGLAVGMIHRGQAVGVVHVYTGRAYQFHRFEIDAIKAIATQAASAVINAKLYEEAHHAEQMDRQLALAGQVQRRMLPTELPDLPHVEIGTVYRPSYAIGGDFYDFLDLGANRLGLVMADVAGKGVPASLQMASLRSAMRAYGLAGHSIEQILGLTNSAFARDALVGEFASVFFGILDVGTCVLDYVNAGHSPPILARAGRLRALTGTCPVLGVFDAPGYKPSRLHLRDGDTLVLFTDGVFEAMNFDLKMFGIKRLRASIRKYAALSAQAMATNILWDVRRFIGLATRGDDISIVVVKIKTSR